MSHHRLGPAQQVDDDHQQRHPHPQGKEPSEILVTYQQQRRSVVGSGMATSDDSAGGADDYATKDNTATEGATDGGHHVHDHDHHHDVLTSLGLFSLMGMGTLFPYNAIVSASDWFESLHPDAKDVAGKLATSSITSLVLTTVLLLPLTQRRRQPLPPPEGEGGKRCYAMNTILRGSLANPVNRIAFGFAIECTILLTFAALEPSIRTAVSLAFAVGIGDAICQSGLYVYAATFHVRCTAAVAFGTAVAGLASSLLRIVTKGIFPDDTDGGRRAGGAAFFGLAALVLVVCLCALRVTVKMDERIRGAFDRGGGHHRLDHDSDLEVEGNDERFDLGDPTDSDEVEREKAVFELDNGSPPAWNPLETRASDVSDDDVAGWNDKTRRRCDERLSRLAGILPPMTVYRETLIVTWRPTLATFLNFFVTLSVFPGTVTSMKSINGLGSWLPVVLVTAFNLFDCVGRGVLALGGVADALVTPIGRQITIADPHRRGGGPGRGLLLGHELPKFANRVGYPSLARIVFLPAVWLCVVPGDPSTTPWIASDWVRCVIVSSLAVTNGYINAACFMVGPSMLEHRRHRDASSLLLLLSSFLGLMLGGFFGMFLDKFLVGA